MRLSEAPGILLLVTTALHDTTPDARLSALDSAAAILDRPFPAPRPPPRLSALASAAAILDWPLPRERDEATCHEAARVVDALLVRVARGRGAVDVALGEGLATLGSGSPVLDLGYSGVGDYAREVLGIAASTAQKM